MFLLNEMLYVKEFVIRTSISVIFAVIILLAVTALEKAEIKKYNKMSIDIFYDNAKYKILKCSIGYLQLPIITIFIDIITLVLLWREFGTNFNEYIGIIHDKAMLSPIITLSFFNFSALVTTLYYYGNKLFYTENYIYVVHFSKKINVSCWEIEKISYYAKKHKQKLIIKTQQEKIVLRSDIFTDGWDEFISYIFAISDKYNIFIEYI